MHGTLVCCVVHWPLIVFQKVNISPHSAAPQQRWPCMRRRAEHSIYQHHMTYNGAISCSPVRFKGRPVQLSILHSGGRDVWWIRKMLSFFGGQRDVKGSLREGLSIYISVCVHGGSSADRSISLFCTDNKNRGGCVDKLNLFSVMLNLKIPPNVPLQWSVTPVLSSCGGMTSREQFMLREPIDAELWRWWRGLILKFINFLRQIWTKGKGKKKYIYI